MPTLIPGDLVVLDNLGAQHNRRALGAIRKAGATPVCHSLEFNPIDLAWSKCQRWHQLKASFKEAKAHTREALDDAIAAACNLITIDDATGWFKHCGYRPTVGDHRRFKS